jgi:hypothetical protein
MLSCKTWYLVGLGVLAATLVSPSTSPGGIVGHLLSVRASSVAQRVSGHALLFLAKAQPGVPACSQKAAYVFNAGPGVDFATLNLEFARRQSDMARVQAELVRAQAERASAIATARYCKRLGATSSVARMSSPDGTI